MTIFYTVLITLTAYRLWRLAAIDQITEPLRAPLIRSDHPAVVWLLDLIGCAWCLGFWLCGALSIGVGLWQDWPTPLVGLVWFSTSTVVGMLSRLESLE